MTDQIRVKTKWIQFKSHHFNIILPEKRTVKAYCIVNEILNDILIVKS